MGEPGPRGDAGTPGEPCTVVDENNGSFSIDCNGESFTLTSGTDGMDGASCTATDNGDGTYTLDCDDDTSVTLSDGTAGDNGLSCTISDTGGGTSTITCEDGTTAVISDGQMGQTGQQGFNAGETPGLGSTVEVADPPNGTYFDVGDQIVVTFELLDAAGNPLTLDDFSTANLYMYGPQETALTTTSVKLLNAETDRALRPHHYIDLHDDSDQLVVDGNTITYTMQAITDELDGTYTIAFWSRLADYPEDQAFQLVDVQIGDVPVEQQIVGNCADCHKGAANGKIYMHHIDNGLPSLDSDPVRTCKACHNNEGYSAIRVCDDGSKPVRIDGVYTCEDGTENWNYAPDPIVRRAHGVHGGAGLATTFNTNPEWGDFVDYTDVVFPAGATNCGKCHVDDRWKEKPTSLTCGSCHDRIDFTTGTMDPPELGSSCTTNSQCVDELGLKAVCNADNVCEQSVHAGGVQTDTACPTCHTSTPGVGLVPIPDSHAMDPVVEDYTVDLSLSAPNNGTHYVDESPVLTISIKNATNQAVYDPTTMLEASFYRARLFVSGPRDHTMPALTTAATGVEAFRPIVATDDGPFDLSGGGSLELAIDGGGTFAIAVADGTFSNSAAATSAEVVAWLNGNATFSAGATAYDDDPAVEIKGNARGTGASIEVIAGSVATALGLDADTYVPEYSGSYDYNDLRVRTDALDEDPRLSRSSTEITYQFSSVDGLMPGTYHALVMFRPSSGDEYSVGSLSFQIGTATAEPRVAANCKSCHEQTTMHGFAQFEPDLCKNCHDYARPVASRMIGDPLDGWGGNAASGRSNFGFGAAPLSRRVHGVHYGHYVDKPEEIHGRDDFSHVIFPQDVRNCVKCHTENDHWKEEPSRLACLACHDSDSTVAHGDLMTIDPTPEDPWNGDEGESCESCHGPGKEFSVENVHNITDPYVGPYPRDPE